jgi:hypothetical protein
VAFVGLAIGLSGWCPPENSRVRSKAMTSTAHNFKFQTTSSFEILTLATSVGSLIVDLNSVGVEMAIAALKSWRIFLEPQNWNITHALVRAYQQTRR